MEVILNEGSGVEKARGPPRRNPSRSPPKPFRTGDFIRRSLAKADEIAFRYQNRRGMGVWGKGRCGSLPFPQQKKIRCFPEGIKRRKGRVLLRLVYSLKRCFKMRFYHNDTTDTTVVRLRCINVVHVVPSWFDIFCLWDSMLFAALRENLVFNRVTPIQIFYLALRR